MLSTKTNWKCLVAQRYLS